MKQVVYVVSPGDVVLWTLGLAMAAGFAAVYVGLAWAGYQDVRNWLHRRRNPTKVEPHPWVADLYGDHHREERAKYASVIRSHGGVCMERECVMPSRRIEPGARWHLAHDHAAGGPYDYLGPAHPECNEHEAHSRGVTWGEDPWEVTESSTRQHADGPDDDVPDDDAFEGYEPGEFYEYDAYDSDLDDEGEDEHWWGHPQADDDPLETQPATPPPSRSARTLFSDDPFA